LQQQSFFCASFLPIAEVVTCPLQSDLSSVQSVLCRVVDNWGAEWTLKQRTYL
jgi:hypothetical protein